MYKLVRPLVFRVDSETAHNGIFMLARAMHALHLTPALHTLYSYEDPILATEVFGKKFPNPVGLAAGFDKNGLLLDVLPALGFGFIEVGTVTPRPQVGNPRPRLFRVPKDQGIVNRMGFNNEGMGTLRDHIAERKSSAILGVNIGKNKDTANEEAVSDYVKCFELLAPHADYMVVNVSSPNTPGLRALQDKEPLRALLAELMRLNHTMARQIPILLKIAPDLELSQLDDVAEIVLGTGIHGLIATNTTIGRDHLVTDASVIQAMGNGGLSGKPIFSRSTEVLRHMARRLQNKVPIIGVGGIFSGQDAYEKIISGASLVQIYSGLIYEGPGLVQRVKRELAELVRKNGFTSLQEAVGSAL